MQRIAEQVQKLVNKERFSEDSLKDNMISEKAAKEIHEAGNCELHEVQQRTDKVKCQRCYFIHSSWISSMSMRRKVACVSRNAFLHKTKI